METITIITAVSVLGVVWGGMFYFLIKAVKFEKQKLLDNNG